MTIAERIAALEASARAWTAKGDAADKAGDYRDAMYCFGCAEQDAHAAAELLAEREQAVAA